VFVHRQIYKKTFIDTYMYCCQRKIERSNVLWK